MLIMVKNRISTVVPAWGPGTRGAARRDTGVRARPAATTRILADRVTVTGPTPRRRPARSTHRYNAEGLGATEVHDWVFPAIPGMVAGTGMPAVAADGRTVNSPEITLRPGDRAQACDVHGWNSGAPKQGTAFHAVR
jgi:hypothetical protein